MNALLFASAIALALSPAEPGHDHSPKLGKLTFESTCNRQAHGLLEQGLGWLHSFEYKRAERSFLDSAAADQTCGIAYWGVAMSLYHPLWYPPTAAELEQAKAALAKAESAGAKSQRERDYVAAITTFFRNAETVDHKTRALAYSAEMEKLHRRYPADREAAVLYALTLIATGTLDSDPDYSRERQAGAILNSVLKQEPDHPGVAHYLIHSFDYPALADLALPAARRYAGVAPASAHAQHMPSHIFTRLGLWDEAIKSNLEARSASIAYAKASGMAGAWDQQLHAMDYLAYAYLQSGRDSNAQGVLDELAALPQVEPATVTVAFAATAIPARVLLERRRFKEAAAYELPAGVRGLEAVRKFGWLESHVHFARAVGAARSGDAQLARSMVAKLDETARSIVPKPGEYDWQTQVSIARQVAQAWTELAEGSREQALATMRAAAELDDSTEKHPVTPGAIMPAREQLGELLLELGRAPDALREYEASLARAPRRLAGLYGAARAAKLAGDRAKASRYYAALLEVAGQGDGTRVEVREARAHAAQHAAR